MTKASICVAFLLLLSAVGAYVDVDSPERSAFHGIENLQKRLPGYGHPLRLHSAAISGSRSGRLLKQRERTQRCSWIGEEQTCRISEAAEVEIFSASGNADAEYFSDHLVCDNLLDQESCYDGGCLWSGEASCAYGVTSREIASCFRNATLYLHHTLHDDLCGVYEDEADCEDDSQCNWDEEFNYCNLDFWNTLTSIPSEDGAPEGFLEIYGLMRNSAIVAFNEDFPTPRSIVNNLESVLEWDPPPFVCPNRFSPLVCEFALPYIRTVPISIYCDARYGREWEACEEDDLCHAYRGSTRVCTAADEVLERAEYEALRIYVDAIHDEALRAVYAIHLNCSQINTIARCESANCVWLDETDCSVSNVQLRNAFLQDFDEEGHPVCHVFVAADRHACEDRLTNRRCESDEFCSWDDFEGSCFPSESAIVEYLLENDPDLAEQFNEVADVCAELTTRGDCLDF